MISPNVAVVIVNWNGASDTALCLDSLDRVRGEWSECIVVDNGSADGSADGVRDAFPWARLLETGANLGYAGGNNRGIEEALRRGADFVLVLNNDTVVAEGMIERLRLALEQDARIGIAGPEVHRRNPPGQFWYAGGRVSRSPFRARHLSQQPPAGRPLAVDYLPGCALLFSRATLERVGLFEERFFLTWEDTDLAARARHAGLTSSVVPGAVVQHAGSISFQRIFSPLYCYYYFRNMLLFARRHFPVLQRPAAYRHAVGFAYRTVEQGKTAEDRRRMGRAAALGIAHFVVGRFGAAPERYTRVALRRRLDAHVAPSREVH